MEGMEAEDFHIQHCLRCFNFKKCSLNQDNVSKCGFITCHLKCGAVFHACKEQEHKQLCLNEKAPCYNKEGGCPCIMPRGQLAMHLKKCPASVIHCTMEWNRWHMDKVSEKQLQHCKEGGEQEGDEQPQLDVALALRDQRLLKQWHSSGKTDQIALRNHFKTQPKKASVTKSEDQEGLDGSGQSSAALDDNDPALLGFTRRVYNQMFQLYGRYLESLDYTALANMLSKLPTSEENKENVVNNRSSRSGFSTELIDAMAKGNTNTRTQSKSSSSRTNSHKVKDNADGQCFDENLVSAIVPHPTRYLGLNPNVEVVGQSLQKEMHTFLCCQEFRRDEYPWHYKNVHSEIHGGLNSWLQERCPLAQYGCTFSRQRLNPMPKGSKVIYNEILESFGVKPDSPGCLNQPISLDENSDISDQDQMKVTSITELPYELLRHIAGFLDSFSLSNLSLTNSSLREVCQSLLTEKGIVTLHWEKKKKGDSFKWEVSKKKWSFSSHFSPVRDWCFEDSNNMNNHLKNCSFFHRNVYSEPFSHIHGYISPNESLYQKLSHSYVITKL